MASLGPNASNKHEQVVGSSDSKAVLILCSHLCTYFAVQG